MAKLERKHFLKHYQGGFAMVLDHGQTVTGQLEQVDMEDGSVLIKSGERSQWVDGEKVTPSLKKWKDVTDQDIRTIFEHARFHGKYFDLTDFKIVRTDSFIGYSSDEYFLYLTAGWNIYSVRRSNSQMTIVGNIGTIIFLLTELGYDVTGMF